MTYFPRGAIALVEPTIGHKKFLHKAKPRFALMKYHHANRLLKRGETAESWFPDSTKVITTTNIVDERNAPIPIENNGHRDGEIDIVEQFQPDFHIPADRSDYLDYDDDYRYEKTKGCMRGTIAMQNLITDAGVDTEIIPFIKTATPKERTLCYATINQFGWDHAAIYCNRYFNDGRGVQIEELIDDLQMVADETTDVGPDGTPLNLVTISCLSPNVLSRVPDTVVAGSGQMVGTDRGWRDSITPTTQSDQEVTNIYADVEHRVADALDVNPDLDRYKKETASKTTPAHKEPDRGEL